MSAPGPSPTWTRPMTRPDRDASSSTDASAYPATHTAPLRTVIATGSISSATVRSSDPVAPSISNSSRETGSATHNRPSPNDTASGLAPGSAIDWVTLSVAGSIRVRVEPTLLATQTSPSPLAIELGSFASGMRSATPPEPGAISETASGPGSAAHHDP